MQYKTEKEQFVKDLANIEIKNRVHLEKLKRKFCANFKVKLVRNSELMSIYRNLVKTKKLEPQPKLEKLFKKRATRTMSGIASISVIAMPYPCPGKCIFCPTEVRVPKSYLSNEPSVMKAIAVDYDPFKQVQVRLKTYYNCGHNSDKIELIIQGGTWSYYPDDYKYDLIKSCFEACNTGLNKKRIHSKTLQEAQKLNETAQHRIVGLTLETRPDYINKQEIIKMRELGCTRVEIGVQSTFDKVLTYNKRLHKIDAVIRATKLLKQAGLKICYHMMPNLPGSDLEKDYQMFVELFTNPDFQPDMLKIYPCSVLKNTELYELYKQGKYKTYDDNELFELLIKIKQIIPPYVRINRLIRDIPTTSIESGNMLSNLRQILQQDLNNTKKICKCIRCREARDKEVDIKNAKLFIKDYPASEGHEYFMHFSSPDEQTLYGFLRLRFNSNKNDNFIPELKNAAIIREVHTYGQIVPIKDNSGEYIQHAGFGTKLIQKAEEIAKQKGYNKIAVIAGIGVREYYKNLGYSIEGTYMTKNI